MQYVFKILNAEKWLTLLEIKPTCIISMYFDSNTCNGKLQKYLQWNNISQSIFVIKILYKIFWETENAIDTMMDICHNTYTNILQDTESVFVNHS